MSYKEEESRLLLNDSLFDGSWLDFVFWVVLSRLK